VSERLLNSSSQFINHSLFSLAISLAWNTYEKIAKPCVQYGESESSLDQTACSTSSVTYKTSRTWANSVRIDGLKPATKYYYKIVSTNSTSDFFQTGRQAGDKTPFTMVTLADLGVVGPDGYTLNGDASKRDTIPQVDPSLEHTTISQLAKSVADYEFIIHPGDLAYADDWQGENE
jgi:acid phosphatase type 7